MFFDEYQVLSKRECKRLRSRGEATTRGGYVRTHTGDNVMESRTSEFPRQPAWSAGIGLVDVG
ncbi:hypothetical protein I3843_14G121400 [Carya illinoinensis]|nr:hypothetical protein I3843_14G121400 [Carya illinoinensis]